MKMKGVLAVCLMLTYLIEVIGGSYTIAYDAACVADDDCADANTYCQSAISPSCAKGKCKCLDYMEWDGADAKCKVMKYYQDRCNTTLTSCQGGTVCSGVTGQCICNGDTNNFYPALGKCVTSATTLKVIGEDCSTVDDCYEEESGSVQCVVPTGASGSQTKCQCSAGYLVAKGACRKPHFSEACTTAVGCVQEVPVTEDDIVVETCSSTTNLCECPSGSTRVDFMYRGRVVNLCLTDYTGTLVADGASCTASNTCQSQICATCPEDTEKKCLDAPSS